MVYGADSPLSFLVDVWDFLLRDVVRQRGELLTNLFQEIDSEVMNGDVSPSVGELSVLVSLLGGFEGEFAVLHYLELTVHTCEYAHGLRWHHLLHNLMDDWNVNCSSIGRFIMVRPYVPRNLTVILTNFGMR